MIDMLLLTTLTAFASGPADSEPYARAPEHAPVCTVRSGPEYYAFPLVSTKSIPGTGYARGHARVSLPATSPFPISLGADGSYVYEVNVAIENMRPPRDGHLVAWVTTPELDRTARLGTLDENLRAQGSVSWNKYIVVVTLEGDDDTSAEAWAGPVVFRGMSKSGAMHTMVGHGALQQENCVFYGYGG
jgi:hypothetical protein